MWKKELHEMPPPILCVFCLLFVGEIYLEISRKMRQSRATNKKQTIKGERAKPAFRLERIKNESGQSPLFV
jgi:hypothetical protein